jgi:hypothetical protein
VDEPETVNLKDELIKDFYTLIEQSENFAVTSALFLIFLSVTEHLSKNVSAIFTEAGLNKTELVFKAGTVKKYFFDFCIEYLVCLKLQILYFNYFCENLKNDVEHIEEAKKILLSNNKKDSFNFFFHPKHFNFNLKIEYYKSEEMRNEFILIGNYLNSDISACKSVKTCYMVIYSKLYYSFYVKKKDLYKDVFFASCFPNSLKVFKNFSKNSSVDKKKTSIFIFLFIEACEEIKILLKEMHRNNCAVEIVDTLYKIKLLDEVVLRIIE